MISKLQAVILAGGKGTRLLKLTNNKPKAMMNVMGEPFINIIINQLKKKGIKNFLILSGYQKKKIIDFFQNKKNINVYSGGINWNTLTRLKKAKKFISNNFLLMYCDNYLPYFNLIRQVKIFKRKKYPLVLSVVKKKIGQKGTVVMKGEVIRYKKDMKSEYTEAGYMLIKKKIFFQAIEKNKKNINEVLENFSKNNKLTYLYYKDPFYCIENKKFLDETRNFFGKKK